MRRNPSRANSEQYATTTGSPGHADAVVACQEAELPVPAVTAKENGGSAMVLQRFTRRTLLEGTPVAVWFVVACTGLVVTSAAPRLAAQDASIPQPVTYSEHIAPILLRNCAACHRPGEIGPFSLLSYGDAHKRADFLAEITADRRMPPWKPEAGIGAFRDERRLSDKEIALIAKWAADGAPEGDPSKAPPLPKFADGWQLGEPDLVLTMAQPFEVPAGGDDIYRCFVIPIPSEEDRMVSAVEFRPGNARVVHHAIMFLDALGQARQLEGKDGKPGFESFGGPGILPTGGLGAWAPGAMPRPLPSGIVKYVRKGSDLVLQVHYHPSGKAESDQSTVGLYFAKQPAKRIVTGVAIVQPDLHLPAGESNCVVRAMSQRLPCDVHVMGVSPHMHNLGRSIKVTAVDPSGRRSAPLIYIKDWDFNWQGAYQFSRPLRLPKGSRFRVEAVYDNSSSNPKNPNSPPKDVEWGEQTNDEMCLVTVQVFTDSEDDLRLVAKMPGYELAAGIEGGVPEESGSDEEAVRPQLADAKIPAEMPAETSSADQTAAADAPGETPVAQAPATTEPPASKKEEPANKEDQKPDESLADIPAEGLPIPERMRGFLKDADVDGDGRLSRAELEKIPSDRRTRLLELLRRNAGK